MLHCTYHTPPSGNTYSTKYNASSQKGFQFQNIQWPTTQNKHLLVPVLYSWNLTGNPHILVYTYKTTRLGKNHINMEWNKSSLVSRNFCLHRYHKYSGDYPQIPPLPSFRSYNVLPSDKEGKSCVKLGLWLIRCIIFCYPGAIDVLWH